MSRIYLRKSCFFHHILFTLKMALLVILIKLPNILHYPSCQWASQAFVSHHGVKFLCSHWTQVAFSLCPFISLGTKYLFIHLTLYPGRYMALAFTDGHVRLYLGPGTYVFRFCLHIFTPTKILCKLSILSEVNFSQLQLE